MPKHISAKEKFTSIHDEKYIKEVEAIEGGFLNLGFNQLRVYFEIVEKVKIHASSNRKSITMPMKKLFLLLQPYLPYN